MAISRSVAFAALVALALLVQPAFVGFTPPRVPLPRQPSPSPVTDVPLKDLSEVADTDTMARAVVSMLAALLVAFAPVAEAQAAKTGGRIGGTAPSAKPKAPPQRSAPSPVVKERVVEKTTIIRQAAPVGAAPVMVAAPAPSLGDMVMGAAVQGVVGGAVSGAVQSAMAPHHNAGPSGTDRVLEMQMRQDERQLDKQSNDIEDLKRQIAELKK